MAWFTHENINSFGILVAAGLAIYSIVDQSKPEDLELTMSRKDFSSLVEAVDRGFPNKESDGTVPVIGPVSWELVVYNPSDKPVTITEYSAHLLSDKGSPIQYSSMKESISYQSDASKTLQLPLQIGPRGVEKLRVSLFLPVYPTNQQKKDCLSQPQPLYEVERCFIQQGTDLFGNAMKLDVALHPGMISYGYQGAPNGPDFLLEFKTGDGSSETVSLSYY